eukprot:scaffold3567_cov26-Tisochrysis_lutea.AAC.5
MARCRSSTRRRSTAARPQDDVPGSTRAACSLAMLGLCMSPRLEEAEACRQRAKAFLAQTYPSSPGWSRHGRFKRNHWPGGCPRWREGGARPPLTPTYNSRLRGEL